MSYSNRNLQIALTLAGISGLVLPFVPFTYDVVPFTDVLLDATLDDSLWQMATPTILLPLLITAGYVARLLMKRAPPWIDVTGYGWAFAAMFLFLVGAADDVGDSDHSLPIILLSATAFAGGIWLSLGEGAARGDGLVALQAAYLAPTTFWIAFALFNELEIGAWLAVVAAFAYSMQVVSVATYRSRALVLFLPLAAQMVYLVITG